jgi:hypothetical protein
MTRATLIAALLTGTAFPAVAQTLGLPTTIESPGEPVTVEPTTIEPLTGAASGSFDEEIGSTSLDAPSVEAAGLAGAGALGLPADMWDGTGPEKAFALVEDARPTKLYSVNRLVRRALVAGATPPEGADGLLAARAQALIRFGAAEEASSLAGAAGRDLDDDLRRTRSEAALIVGRDEILCDKDILDPAAPLAEDTDNFWVTLRAYCLAQTGDPLAPVAINAMVELGSVDPVDAPLLEALVDESLIDFIPVPHASMLTPLRIAMLRSLGRANQPFVQSAPLPMIAGLFALESTGSKGALIAAERLEAVGAIETKTLRDLYISLADDVDGAIGARAKAVRDADKSPDARAMGNALIASARSDGTGGFSQLGRVMAPFAARLPAADAAGLGAAGYALRDSMLLGEFVREASAWSAAQGAQSPTERADVAAVLAIADPTRAGDWTRAYGDALRERTRGGDEHARRALASLAGFDIALRPNLPIDGYLKAAEDGKTAETVLSAAAAIGKEDPPTARTLDTLIRALRAVGLTEDARRIAIEAMLTERWRQ